MLYWLLMFAVFHHLPFATFLLFQYFCYWLPNHHIPFLPNRDASHGGLLLEGSALSLQALAKKYGSASAEAHAATTALLQAIGVAASRLRAAFDGQVVVQVAALGTVPLDSLRELMEWRDVNARRALLVTGAWACCVE